MACLCAALLCEQLRLEPGPHSIKGRFSALLFHSDPHTKRRKVQLHTHTHLLKVYMRSLTKEGFTICISDIITVPNT